MPETQVIFYRDGKRAPVLDWLREQPRDAVRNITAAIRELERRGSDLRRPHADYLRDKILELRARTGRVQHRVLYTFVGKDMVLLAGQALATSMAKSLPVRLTRPSNVASNT